MRWEWLKRPGSGHSGTYQKGIIDPYYFRQTRAIAIGLNSHLNLDGMLYLVVGWILVLLVVGWLVTIESQPSCIAIVIIIIMAGDRHFIRFSGCATCWYDVGCSPRL